jgi:Flp pilus assembly protein TadD
MRMGGTAGAILNAANEEAVSAYLGSDGSDERCVVGPMPFSAIAEVTAWTLRSVATRAIVGLDDVLCADGDAAARGWGGGAMSQHEVDQISRLIAEGRAAEARARAMRLAQSGAKDARVQQAVSGLLAAMSQMPQAVYYAQRAAQLAPGEPELAVFLARQLIVSGEPATALTALEPLHAKRPTDPALSAAKAECLGILQRFSEGERVARAAFEAHPTDAGLAALLAGALLNLGRIEEATPLVRGASLRFADDATLASGLAHVLNYDPGATREEQLEAAE